MTDSKAKGTRAELALRDVLNKATGLGFERTPSSGALSAKHMMKGDLYIPGKDNTYAIECKSYEDSHFNTEILTSKSPKFLEWWTQACRQAKDTGKRPLLMFKFNRSKWFLACLLDEPNNCKQWMTYENYTDNPVRVVLLEEWLNTTKVEWTK